MVRQLLLLMSNLRPKGETFLQNFRNCRDFLENQKDDHLSLLVDLHRVRTILLPFFSCVISLFIVEVMPKQQKRSTSSANAGGGVDDFVPDGTLDDDFFVGEKEEQEEEDNDER